MDKSKKRKKKVSSLGNEKKNKKTKKIQSHKTKKVKETIDTKENKLITQTLPCYGEVKCSKELCKNKAYFFSIKTRNLLCGVHSKKIKRQELEKNPQKLKMQRDEFQRKHEESLEAAARENRQNGCKGQVIVSKLLMMKTPEPIPGFLQVWPNNRAKGKPGFPCPSLSPMRLHAKDHNEHVWVNEHGKICNGLLINQETKDSSTQWKLEKLPPALTIENYHQFSKVFPSEANQDGWPYASFWEDLREAYQNPTPFRHKPSATKVTKTKTKKTKTKSVTTINSDKKSNNKNIPLYSCRSDSQGNWHKFSYLESRWFYCIMYEKRASQQQDFQTLVKKIEEGYNLQILGYDGYSVTQSLDQHYLDISKPFGHELVLFTLLTVSKPQDRPWHKFASSHPHLYHAF